MNAIKRYWIDFAAWVRGNRPLPAPAAAMLIPTELWADHKRAVECSRKAHRGQRDAYAHLRKATNSKLIEGIFTDACEPARLVETHPWLFRDPDAFVAAVKATARRAVAEACR